MALLLAPYNNAMRLGQGFNSYTQQICVDDAVLIDPLRAENVVSNDGTTMRIMAQKEAKPSAWTRQREIITDERATDDIKLKPTTSPATAAQTPHGIAKIEKAPSKPSSSESGKPAESSTEELDESKATQEVAKTEEANAGDQADAEASETSAAAVKSESDSLDHIESQDLESDEPETADESPDVPETTSGGDEAIVKQSESSASEAEGETPVVKTADPHENSSTTDGPAKPRSPSTAAISAQKPSLGAAAPKRGPVRSSSVDAAKPSKPSKPDVIPQHKAKILRKIEKASASEGLKEDPAEAIARKKEEEATLAAERAYQKQLEKELREEQLARRKEERDEQREIRKEKRDFDAVRRKEAREAISDAAKKKAMSMADLQKIMAQNQFVDRFSGMSENQQDFAFDPSSSRGPSQIVTYTSRFVDRLSDVTDDMCVSGSLSIKAAKLGGSGKGSFVDSDKFKESDLNFYISVKVINHTVNFKDALVYNPLRSVDENDSDKFRKVYGDSFISGFMEGGEFNAIVSMKILNKAKKRDIQAEAKVAFTAGPGIDVTAEANVGIARSNIETNTETTIQVSWAGGGHIKPMDQQWDIKSLMQAAARFPDLVADCPQRTYAILTKYETLRSFVARQPASFSPLQYENAQIYTNTLLDSFMSYKALYKRLGEQIFNVQGKTMEIKPRAAVAGTEAANPVSQGSKNAESGLYPFVEDMTPFEASLKGLSDARIAIRRQMARIVNEVTLIEGNPKLATDEDHPEPFQSPIAFEVRLPEVGIPERLNKASLPLTGRRIIAKTQTEQEYKDSVEENEQLENLPPLYMASADVSMDEQSALDKIKDERPGLSMNLRVTAPAGSLTEGTSFNNLDVLQSDWNLTKIRIEIMAGFVKAFWLHYDNGLIIQRGKTFGGRMVEMSRFAKGERIIAATVHTGIPKYSTEAHVLSLNLYTNRGRSLLGQASKCISKGGKTQDRDGCMYNDVSIKSFDSPLKEGNLKGFWGRSDESGNFGIWRLGLIWGDMNKDTENAIELDDSAATLWSQIESAKEEGLRSERAALWGNRSSLWRTVEVQIYNIIYHGQTITSDAVAQKFLDYARKQQNISEWTPALFGLTTDPAPGVWKTAYIFYRYNDTGPLRVLREAEKWDPFPS